MTQDSRQLKNKSCSSINTQYNSKKNIHEKTWYYSTAEEKDFKKIKFKMRMFYNSEMIDMLNSLGISIKTIWGGYEREKYNEHSAQQIFCCQITQNPQICYYMFTSSDAWCQYKTPCGFYSWLSWMWRGRDAWLKDLVCLI